MAENIATNMEFNGFGGQI